MDLWIGLLLLITFAMVCVLLCTAGSVLRREIGD